MSRPSSTAEGKTAEFVRLFAAENRRLYGYVRALIYNPADADEVYQSTCQVLWAKFDDFQPGSNFFAWAASIARLEAMAMRRQRGKESLVFSDSVHELIGAVAERTQRAAGPRHLALSECVDQLRPDYREMIQLRYEAGATTKSVAQRLGRSTNAIYKSLERIHSLLLECVQGKLAEGKPLQEGLP